MTGHMVGVSHENLVSGLSEIYSNSLNYRQTKSPPAPPPPLSQGSDSGKSSFHLHREGALSCCTRRRASFCAMTMSGKSNLWD